MAHRCKNKEDKNLVWIEKTFDEESTLNVAINVLHMYDSDFNLTIREISEILLCDRQWVVKHVKDNVKHIFLNENYRQFLRLISAEHWDELVILKDYYYFSRTDFYRWLKENTVITRQTIMVDLSNYCEDQVKFRKETDKYFDALKDAKTIMQRMNIELEYNSRVYKSLDKIGRKCFDNKVTVTERKATAVVLKDEKLPRKFTSIKLLKSDINKSLEIVYRELYKYGALKYTIAMSLVRYDGEFSVGGSDKYSFLITVPYEMF